MWLWPQNISYSLPPRSNVTNVRLSYTIAQFIVECNQSQQDKTKFPDYQLPKQNKNSCRLSNADEGLCVQPHLRSSRFSSWWLSGISDSYESHKCFWIATTNQALKNNDITLCAVLYVLLWVSLEVEIKHAWTWRLQPPATPKTISRLENGWMGDSDVLPQYLFESHDDTLSFSGDWNQEQVLCCPKQRHFPQYSQ